MRATRHGNKTMKYLSKIIPDFVRSAIPNSVKPSKVEPTQAGESFATHFNLHCDDFVSAVEEGVNHYHEIERKLAAELGEEYFERYSGGAGVMEKLELSILYALVRTTKPNIAVETGVAQGASTSLILEALSENNSGHLYSVDLPRFSDDSGYSYQEGDFPIEGFNAAVIPEGKEPGWLVDTDVRDRWTLQTGRSTDLLHDIVSNTGVDIFIHDSEHSYKNIMWELSVVAPNLTKGGWMWVDDADWNDAFTDFSEGVSWSTYHLGSAGALRSTKKYEETTRLD